MNIRRLLFGKAKAFDEWEIQPKELKLEMENVLGKGQYPNYFELFSRGTHKISIISGSYAKE
jgi:hypothetical protein